VLASTTNDAAAVAAVDTKAWEDEEGKSGKTVKAKSKLIDELGTTIGDTVAVEAAVGLSWEDEEDRFDEMETEEKSKVIVVLASSVVAESVLVVVVVQISSRGLGVGINIVVSGAIVVTGDAMIVALVVHMPVT